MFVIELPGDWVQWLYNPKRRYVAGPRKGQSEEITWAEFENIGRRRKRHGAVSFPGISFGKVVSFPVRNAAAFRYTTKIGD